MYKLKNYRDINVLGTLISARFGTQECDQWSYSFPPSSDDILTKLVDERYVGG
jgi:hypothetical protein